MCESKTVITFNPHGTENLINDGALAEKAKELLIALDEDQTNEVEVCQLSLVYELVSRCKKEFPKFGWAVVNDRSNTLSRKKYFQTCLR